MSEVKRYDCSGTMCQAEGGDWVCVELLQSAQSELAVLSEHIELLTADLAWSENDSRDQSKELAALREELADRKRKHLRSCQIAIGKSQLAKERHAELIELRSQLAAVNREKNDVAYRANETAEKLNSMTISKAIMRNQLKQKLAQTQQRLTAAEQRNADAIAKLELAASMMDDDERGNRFAEVCRIAIAAIKPTESGASE